MKVVLRMGDGSDSDSTGPRKWGKCNMTSP